MAWLYASRTISVDELTNMIDGRKQWRRWIYNTWLHVKCKLVGGHSITKQRWHERGNFSNGEWHFGCRRCPLFWIETD